MPYDNPGKYSLLTDSDDCGCSQPSTPPANVGCKECSCCPPGLVEQPGPDGKTIGCLTPNDSEIYMANVYRCPDGFVRYVKDGIFIGCVTVEDLLLLNPPA